MTAAQSAGVAGPESFSVAAWSRTAKVYALIRDMPFNRELATGELTVERFQHYIIQDAHYLVAFAQALALAAAKSDEPTLIREFAEAAATAVAVERELHTRYFDAYGLTPERVAAVAASPICHHYGAFLVATAFREPLPVVAAALLPCFWIYREVGRHVVATGAARNPFQTWIDTYSGPEFSTAVDRMIAVCDGLARPASAATLDAMHAAFARAAQLEWMFWDGAYRLEQWPVVT